MKKQSGFTLIELAIVLVIIGLLLGGVLKGQELITNAKVKSMANELKAMQIMVYGYQDKFRALPGDDILVTTHILNSTLATTGGTAGNAQLEGAWNSLTNTDETYLFWQHVRMSGLAQGSPLFGTAAQAAAYIPRNSDGGQMGISSMLFFKGATGFGISDANFEGTFAACTAGITGKLAKQIDVTIDDGNPQTGSVRARIEPVVAASAPSDAIVSESALHTVCLGF
ncbi:MAG: prepilin-type N-terminal cleavage/methylation domain-containing protein [Methylophilaceae bacterium]